MRFFHMAALTAATLTLAASAQNDTNRYYKVYNNTTVSAECQPLAAYMKVSAGCSRSSTYTRVEDEPILLTCDSNDPAVDLWDNYDGSIRARINWSCPAAPQGVSVDRVDRVTMIVRITGLLTSCGRTDTVLNGQVECTYPGLRPESATGG